MMRLSNTAKTSFKDKTILSRYLYRINAKAKHAKTSHFPHVSFWFRMVVHEGFMKAKLPQSHFVLLSLASLEFCFASFSFSFTLFRIFFDSQNLETIVKTFVKILQP
jgi:hypothetical protein